MSFRSQVGNGQEYWIAVEHYRPPSQDWQALVPIQPWHGVKLGVQSQSMLVGSRQCDMRMVSTPTEKNKWDFSQAKDHCEKVFIEHKGKFNKESKISRRNLFSFLDNLSKGQVLRATHGPVYRRDCRTQVLVELKIPDEKFEDVFEDVDKFPTNYLIMHEFGLHCIDIGNFNIQPSRFQIWFNEALIGNRAKPNKTPKFWKLKPRDCLIYYLVEELKCHGFNPTRNDTSKPVSACDAVARAAVAARIGSITSYDAVRKIYDRLREEAKNVPSVRLRE
ncbi:MAG: hypothetical protein AAGK02_02690 [Pseudomonadota bacterium]